jgi:hypothetical protein
MIILGVGLVDALAVAAASEALASSPASCARALNGESANTRVQVTIAALIKIFFIIVSLVYRVILLLLKQASISQ